MFIELSPHITLRSNVRGISKLIHLMHNIYDTHKDVYTNLGAKSVPYVLTLVRNENDSKMWANTLGVSFEQGLAFDWKTIYPNPIHIRLPNYPFDYKVS